MSKPKKKSEFDRPERRDAMCEAMNQRRERA